MIYSHIVACSSNNGIGVSGKLPWNLKADLKRFKSLTSFHPIIVGHNTFSSISKVLPNRLNIVISRDESIRDRAAEDPNLVVYNDLSSCIKDVEDRVPSLYSNPFWNDEIFIIGGAKIYQETLSLGIISRIYLTLVHKNIEADSFYPAVDTALFCELDHSPLQTEGDYQFEYITYEKKL